MCIIYVYAYTTNVFIIHTRISYYYRQRAILDDCLSEHVLTFPKIFSLTTRNGPAASRGRGNNNP